MVTGSTGIPIHIQTIGISDIIRSNKDDSIIGIDVNTVSPDGLILFLVIPNVITPCRENPNSVLPHNDTLRCVPLFDGVNIHDRTPAVHPIFRANAGTVIGIKLNAFGAAGKPFIEAL